MLIICPLNEGAYYFSFLKNFVDNEGCNYSHYYEAAYGWTAIERPVPAVIWFYIAL